MNGAAPQISPWELKKRLRTAHSAGLRYVTDQMPGIRREKSGGGFRFRYATGDIVTDEEVLKRIKSLVIPPAWTDVWICPDPSGHLQATGRDARGRKQNRYHSLWREVRDENKFARTIAFGKTLPKIRRAVEKDLKAPPRSRRNVLATVVRLLEKSLIRVGNLEYARQNDSFGLTTMRDKHVDVRGPVLKFHFRGKSGKWHDVGLRDKRLARLVKSCQDIPGQELFQYINDDGTRQTISSEDVNAYIREAAGREFTAKDFRTWAGTVLAAGELCMLNEPTKTAAKKGLVAAVKTVAAKLGNTPSVCRKCYIHPHVIKAYNQGTLLEALNRRDGSLPRNNSGLSAEEKAVLCLLQKSLAAEKKEKSNPAAPFEETLKRLRKRGKRGAMKEADLRKAA